MSPSVEITFDCLPLRSANRWDIPLDASPAQEEHFRRIVRASEKHGLHNTYYLSEGRCTFCLTNDPAMGLLMFAFEGTVLTDATDQRTASADLEIELQGEICDWLTSSALAWFRETVARAVMVEFDRFLSTRDRVRAGERLRQIEAESHARGAYLGMGL
jgi:hypothetical protein